MEGCEQDGLCSLSSGPESPDFPLCDLCHPEHAREGVRVQDTGCQAGLGLTPGSTTRQLFDLGQVTSPL